MTNPPKPSDEVEAVLQKHFGDDDSDVHYYVEKAIAEAKQAITAIIERAVVEELKDWRTMIQRLSEYADNKDSLIEFDDRIATLERERTEESL